MAYIAEDRSLHLFEHPKNEKNLKLIFSKAIGDYGNNILYQEIYNIGSRKYLFQMIDGGGNGLAFPTLYSIRYNCDLLWKGGKFKYTENIYFTVSSKSKKVTT